MSEQYIKKDLREALARERALADTNRRLVRVIEKVRHLTNDRALLARIDEELRDERVP